MQLYTEIESETVNSHIMNLKKKHVKVSTKHCFETQNDAAGSITAFCAKTYYVAIYQFHRTVYSSSAAEKLLTARSCPHYSVFCIQA